MTLPITTDLGHNPWRVLAKQYTSNTTAMVTTAPNSLTTPGLSDAMGVVPESGMVSFFHDGSSCDITIYIFNQMARNIGGNTQGWILGAESTALNTKTVAQRALASFKAPPGAAYYLQASAGPPTNLVVHDGGPHERNLNTDTSFDVHG